MKIINSFIIIFIFSISVYSQLKEEVVAKINGESIFKSELERNIEEITMNLIRLNPESANQPDFKTKAKKMAFEKILSETLIRQQAKKQEIKVSKREIEEGINEVKTRFSVDREGKSLTPQEREKFFMDELKKQGLSYEDFKARIENDLMARKLIDQVIRPNLKKPSEDEIKSFFSKIVEIVNSTTDIKINENNSDYVDVANKFKEIFGERIRLRHILIKFDGSDSLSKSKAYERAKNIRDRLIKGEDFEDVALKESDDKVSAKRGGDIGYVIRGILPKNIEDIAFKLCPGEISEIIENDFGYNIIQVSEKKIAEKIKYELVKDDIENIIMQQRFADEIEKYVNLLKKDAKIEIYDLTLK